MSFTDEKSQIAQDLLHEIPGPKSEPFIQFVTLFLDKFSKDYLVKSNKEELITIIMSVWATLQKKNSTDSLIDIHIEPVQPNQPERLFITVVNSDRPYLVDSLQALLTQWNLKSHLFIHPVFNIQRTYSKTGEPSVRFLEPYTPKKKSSSKNASKESIIFIQLKNTLSPKELEEFHQELFFVLNQLKLFSDDQSLIENDLEKIATHLEKKIDHTKKLDSESFPVCNLQESLDFVHWIKENCFIFFGSRYYSALSGHQNSDFFCIEENAESSKGIYKDPRISEQDAFVPYLGRSSIIPDETRPPKIIPDLIRITKTSFRSTIERSSRMDLIEILDWGEDGQNIQGIYQFVGIFKKELFNLSAFDIPLLRQKAHHVFDTFNFDPAWYDGKSLIAIINSIPRDEMFYMSDKEILNVCSTVLHLQNDTNLSLFIRTDPYGQYITLMTYLSRDRFSQQLKETFGDIIIRELGGTISSSVVQIGDLPFARIIYILHFEPPHSSKPNAEQLEQLFQEASLSCFEQLKRYMDQLPTITEKDHDIINKYRNSFSSAYEDYFTPSEIYDDILQIEKISDENPIECHFYQQPETYSTNNRGLEHLKITLEETQQLLRVKIYFNNKVLLLADLLPILANMGLNVLAETTYTVQRPDREIHIHYFDVSINKNIDWAANAHRFQEGFRLIWNEKYENDRLNQLILTAQLEVRQILILRAYIRYLIQAKTSYSASYIQSAIIQYPSLCRSLVTLFEKRFQVCELKDKPSTETESEETIVNHILEQLNDVISLDHDRMFRRLLNAILSTLRTNYYQSDATNESKNYISFKLDSQKLTDLPAPRPLFEIFVYSSWVEGIHLRGGKVARGGIRWSDRFDDYRTEILGLMKAQTVKNTVIVPLGSKGGFVIKRKPLNTNPTTIQANAIECYKTFLRGMLDLTDNLVEGKIIPPPCVCRYDDDDPYLVVAADKGTATFSDIANDISLEYNFWLADAFASGGSAGYDHKAMGITSRGAWESVKRHFREEGKDCQVEPFTVIGVGDMSGDVFGNGMLRSPMIHLIAAFDHRHIFLDPTPDPNLSFAERTRMFLLPRSSWGDYDRECLSAGGAIYSRSEKKIVLTPEIQLLLQLPEKEHSPDEVIQAIFKTPADLLWFGGIGTFVKATHESNADVGDFVNASVRVNGRAIKAKIITEGANLGITQEGRIEYALMANGRINTDAIDNSAGVDCSDHEVNLKILFSSLTHPVSKEKRNEILKGMTDEVATLVLQNNYEQTLILTVLEAWSKEDLSIFQNLIKILENEVHLNRTLEGLPDDDIFDQRHGKGQGMTRPELATMLAFSKIALYNKILESNIVDQPFYNRFLLNYFPATIREEFKADILNHPLRKEIIATVLTNILINRVGPTFVYEISQVSGCTPAEVVHAFFITVDVLELDQWWAQINKMDSLMISPVQMNSYTQIASVLRICALRLLSTSLPVLKENLHATINELRNDTLLDIIKGTENEYFTKELSLLLQDNTPENIAEDLVLIPYLSSIIDIAILRPGRLQPNEIQPREIAFIYFTIRSHFGFNSLIELALHFETKTDWQRNAQLSLLDDIGQIIMALTHQVIISGYTRDLHTWLAKQAGYFHETQAILAQVKSGTTSDIGKLAFAVRHLQRMPEVKKIIGDV